MHPSPKGLINPAPFEVFFNFQQAKIAVDSQQNP
jgi:hypothetical protein